MVINLVEKENVCEIGSDGNLHCERKPEPGPRYTSAKLVTVRSPTFPFSNVRAWDTGKEKILVEGQGPMPKGGVRLADGSLLDLEHGCITHAVEALHQNRVNISAMKELSRDRFFSRENMRFFKGAKYIAQYDKEAGVNYIQVISPYGGRSWHIFNTQTGKTDPIPDEVVPDKLR